MRLVRLGCSASVLISEVLGKRNVEDRVVMRVRCFFECSIGSVNID